MIQATNSPLENLAAFALTFVIGILAAVALSGYLVRARVNAQAGGCRYPMSSLGEQGACCWRPVSAPAMTQDADKP